MEGWYRKSPLVSCVYILLWVFSSATALAQGLIADHTRTDITSLSEAAINLAKATLHIGYGHTSHGSQITSGMTGLVGFANGGGKGLSHPTDIFAWNNGGTGGALDLEEGDGYGTGWLDHDCGYYPDWVNETRTYLDDPSHADVNVIVWSWCGQAASRTEQTMIDTYLNPMSQLENDYPNVIFVYMTGHANGTGETGNLHLRNQEIRNYCINNNKVLFDFYDIECYDPDGNYYGNLNVNDDCSYTGGNWATEWQNSHTEGVDWYNCSSAHSQPLNANQKACAAWWMWTNLAADLSLAVQMNTMSARVNGKGITVTWRTESETECAGFHIWRSRSEEGQYNRMTTAIIHGHGNSSTTHEYNYYDINVEDNVLYWYKIEEISISGQNIFHGPVLTALAPKVPEFFHLSQNFPNPFNPITEMNYQILKESKVSLRIFNLMGKEVRTLVDAIKKAGFYTVTWDGKDDADRPLVSGVYTCRLVTEGGCSIRKMMLLR